MVSADMCKHDWPGTSCPDCRREEELKAVTFANDPSSMLDEDTGLPPPSPARLAAIPPGSVWEYKGKYYRAEACVLDHLAQDPETGDWTPAVQYRAEKGPGTHLTFYRTSSEWLRKFRRVS